MICGILSVSKINNWCLSFEFSSESDLEGWEEEVDEELGETQTDGGLGRFVRHKDEDHLMDAQQGDQGESGLSQPERNKRYRTDLENKKTTVDSSREKSASMFELTWSCNRCISFDVLGALTQGF